MGKKVRKKACGSFKEKRVSTSAPKAVLEENNLNAEIVADGEPLVKERRLCVHLDKAVDLEKISPKIESAVSTGCEDCREGAVDRKFGKGKSKHGRKKGASDSKAESKATWVCLQCGHFSCGGVGLPTSPQSHAVRHARQSRHPLVIQIENPHLRWCFPCDTLIPIGKVEDTGEQKDVLSDIVKLLKRLCSKGNLVDVEDIWFGIGGGSVLNELKSGNEELVIAEKDFYAVSGLLNLGNTCFFNSVLQNLLAVDILREYLLSYDGSMGPLTSSLKKIFVETSPGTGLRNVVNPKPLFGCVCAKAPQFRGYQQQDSHELLRYLLDGMSTEELSAKRSAQSSSENPGSHSVSPTFVDTIFGGQLSSTVCCVECGHSSVVYEPFLDLSLPVPTKKPPPSKKALPSSRTKKTKLPPKRGSRNGPKLNKDEYSTPVLIGCNPSSNNESSSAPHGASLSCSSSEDHVGTDTMMVVAGNDGIPSSQVFPRVKQHGEQEADCLAWLDYLEPVPLLADQYLAAENEELPVSQGCCSKVGDQHAAEDTNEISAVAIVHHSRAKPISESTVDDLGNENPLEVQDNEILLLPYKEDSFTTTEGINVDAVASTVSIGEDALGFDGLGDLFNEPEIDVPTSSVTNDVQVSEQLRNGPAGNSSESDANEVDDTDSPVSIDSCLVHFIKPELLTGEHSWHCENCSNLLRDKKQKVRKNQFKLSSAIQRNISNDVCSSSKAFEFMNQTSPDCCTIVMANHNNGSSGVDDNLKKLDALQINGSIQEKEEYPKKDDNLKKGSSDLNEDLEKFDAVQINGHCPKSNQEKEGCAKQENMYYLTSGGSKIVGPSDELNVNGESIKLYNVSGNHGPGDAMSGVDEDETETEEVGSKSVKVMRDATKRILINLPPRILTIHLKRFRQDARGRLSKLNGYVGFKEYIDLGPYLDSRSPERKNDIYRLVGVVEHSGSMRGGHYIAYVRGVHRFRGRLEEENRHANSVWYYASDAQVRETTVEEVLRCEAYLLFYEKVNP